MKYDLILLVAGLGQRMQAGMNKVWLELEGKPVFQYSLDLFLEDRDCQRLILVGRSEEETAYAPYLSDRVCFVVGGQERQDSARLGLELVTSPYVMVHDGARPLLTADELAAIKQIPNSILAVPAKDTIKQVRKGQIERTIPRDLIYQAQTPQFFERDLLKKVYQQAEAEGYTGTDDASLVEAFSDHRVAIVPGSYSNIKLTTPEDLLFAESILKNRKEG